MVCDVFFYHFGFGNDVAGYKLIGYFVAFDQWIEEYTSFEVFQQYVFTLVGKSGHVSEVDFTVFVEGSGKSFVRSIDVGQLVFVECHGMVEDVGFDGITVFVTF